MVSYWYIIFVYESLPQGRNGGPKLQGSKIGDEEGRVAPLSAAERVEPAIISCDERAFS